MTRARDLADVIAGASTLPKAAMPTDSIIQIKESSAQDEVSHSAAWEDSGLSVSITPTSTSSKILIFVNHHSYKTGSSGGGAYRLLRDSTVIHQDSQAYQSYGNELSNRGFHNFQYIDTPSSTSAITYKTQGYEYAGDFRTNQGGYFESRIIVMEISG